MLKKEEAIGNSMGVLVQLLQQFESRLAELEKKS